MRPRNQASSVLNDAPSGKRTGRRRGTVIVLALAVLAILAIAAVAYVSVVRIDRESSVAVARQANYEQQVNAVVNHIGSLLAADLSGNKIVTNSTPRRRGDAEIWPRMFEDAETWDAPSTDAQWRANEGLLPDLIPVPNLNVAQRVARPDDAWLASIEPRWVYGNLETTSEWPQITNLRSAYTWNQREVAWQRGDGRYVDLLQWYLQAEDGRADASINLNEVGDGSDPMGPSFGFGDAAGRTRVFDVQTAELDLAAASSQRQILEPSDERMWVDTDGDLRADARWQQLESLGSLYGLTWVVAARVVDASAFMNVQTAIEFPYRDTATATAAGRDFFDVMGLGKTPADIDLVRLLSYSIPIPSGDTRPGIFDGDIHTDNLELQFRNHLTESLGVESIINDLRENPGTAPDDPAFTNVFEQAYNPWSRANPLTRLQREALFSYATSTVDRPITPAATSYPRRDMLDLFTYYSVNNASILSKFEQRIDDGPQASSSYLPDPDDTNPAAEYGPLRAAEPPSQARKFSTSSSGSGVSQPSVQRIKFDVRRQLTMLSGVGQISPIPVLSDVSLALKGVGESGFAMPLIRFSDIAAQRAESLLPTIDPDVRTARERATNEMLQRLFSAFVWALAPLSTDRQLAPGVPAMGSADEQQYHYGGGINSPAAAMTNAKASYAVLRAAALAVNLFESSYANPANDNSNRLPVITRLFNFGVSGNPAGGAQSAQNQIRQMETDTFAGNQVIHTFLPQGTIRPDALPTEHIPAGPAGVTLISVGRQPFLRELHAIAVYQPNDDPLGSGSASPQIDPTNSNHQLGSILALELGNPWPHSISLRGYTLQLKTGIGEFAIDLPDVTMLAEDPGTPGDQSVTTIAFISDAPPAGIAEMTTAWTNFKDAWLVRVRGVGAIVEEALMPGGVVFQNLQASASPSRASVVLIRKAQDFDADGVFETPFDYIADRMTVSPTVPTGEPFPSVLLNTHQIDVSALIASDPDLRIGGTGRVVVGSTLYRATVNPAGAPAYVVERPSANIFYRKQPIPNDPGVNNPLEQKWLLPVTSPPGESAIVDLLASPHLIVDADPDADPPVCPTGLSVCRIGREKCQIGEQGLPNYSLVTNLYTEPSIDPPTGAVTMPIQLYVPARVQSVGPNGYEEHEALQYRSELLQLSAYCHMYRHPDTSDPDVTVAWDMASTNQPWSTFSEQLGSNPEFTYDAQGGAFNPYLGVLDPSRFVLSTNVSDDLPDALTIPLALRVLEPFEPLTRALDSRLIQGRINVNTASAEVLACLPLVAPWFNVPQGALPGGLTAQLGVDVDNGGRPTGRVATLLEYRDRNSVNNTPTTPAMMLQNPLSMQGLRDSGGINADPTQSRGLVSTGEIAIMHPWDNLGDMTPTGAPGQYFGELGADALQIPTTPDAQMIDVNNYAIDGTTLLPGSQRDPIDDPEERLAIYRAISNIVTTRSDVFIAWFVLRGYDPDIIDNTPVEGGNNPTLEQARNAMNGVAPNPSATATPLRPTYESRWLVVYDRSNCYKPTDRPRILMQVELPSARP